MYKYKGDEEMKKIVKNGVVVIVIDMYKVDILIENGVILVIGLVFEE